MKTTTINGINFKFKNFQSCFNGKTSIYDLYKTPSYEKVKIFNEYNEKLDGITGLTGNCFFFSIYGYIFNDGKKYFVKITPSNDFIKES